MSFFNGPFDPHPHYAASQPKKPLREGRFLGYHCCPRLRIPSKSYAAKAANSPPCRLRQTTAEGAAIVASGGRRASHTDAADTNSRTGRLRAAAPSMLGSSFRGTRGIARLSQKSGSGDTGILYPVGRRRAQSFPHSALLG